MGSPSTLSSTLVVLLSILAALDNSIFVFGAPRPSTPTTAGQTINLTRRRPGPSNGTTEEWGLWAKNQKDILQTKYGGQKVEKRASGMNLMTNQNADSSFFGSLAIGTPPISYDVILDTGSSDLWVADKACTIACNNIATFDSTQSTTFINSSTPFSIQYGSGSAQGTLGQDIVQMAGFSVTNQVFALVDQMSSGLLESPVSGLLGLAWQTIAASGATPFWQTLVAAGAWDQPLMTFQLTRFMNVTGANVLEPGGTFTMGTLNSSLYTGDIDYVNIPSITPSFWTLPLTTLLVQGNSVSVGTGSSAYAAIDTGTTLIGGPSLVVASVYAQIPGSAPATGDYEGYYTYPCGTAVNVTLSFGGRSWAISSDDFELARIGSNLCLGAFFELASSNPPWIIGDSFLKNVYSVFRYSPPSIGFASLSETALGMSTLGGAVPSPTIGSTSSVSVSNSAARVSSTARGMFSTTQLVLLASVALGAWGL